MGILDLRGLPTKTGINRIGTNIVDIGNKYKGVIHNTTKGIIDSLENPSILAKDINRGIDNVFKLVDSADRLVTKSGGVIDKIGTIIKRTQDEPGTYDVVGNILPRDRSMLEVESIDIFSRDHVELICAFLGLLKNGLSDKGSNKLNQDELSIINYIEEIELSIKNSGNDYDLALITHHVSELFKCLSNYVLSGLFSDARNYDAFYTFADLISKGILSKSNDEIRKMIVTSFGNIPSILPKNPTGNYRAVVTEASQLINKQPSFNNQYETDLVSRIKTDAEARNAFEDKKVYFSQMVHNFNKMIKNIATADVIPFIVNMTEDQIEDLVSVTRKKVGKNNRKHTLYHIDDIKKILIVYKGGSIQ